MRKYRTIRRHFVTMFGWTGATVAAGMLLFGCAESRTPTEAAAGNGTRMERAATVRAPEAVRDQGRGVEEEIVRPIVESVGRRVALVIGNAAYEEPGSGLTNPVRDAEAVAEVLRELDFEMIVATDATLERMEQATHDFIQKLRSGDAAVFYYSGHGLEQDGENYLVPVDFSAAYYDDEVLLRRRTLVANKVQERMEAAGARVRLLILDACRSNLFDPNGKSLGRGGLAAMAPRGGLVAFAAEAGRVASDNRDEMNGLFTKHLVAVLREPGLTARDLFARVHDRVRTESHGRQAPATYDAGAGGFVFRASHRRPTMVDVLAGTVDVDARRENDRTPLYAAAREGDVKAIRTLVDVHGVNVLARDENGGTALHYAVREGQVDTIRTLVDVYGLDVHARGALGRTLLHIAAERGHADALRTLVDDYEADVNAPDSGDSTALHVAAERGDLEIVRELLARGANVRAKDSRGRAPADLVSRNRAADNYDALAALVFAGLESFRHGNVDADLWVLSELKVPLEYYGYGDRVEVKRGDDTIFFYSVRGQIGHSLLSAGLVQSKKGLYLVTSWSMGAHSELLIVQELAVGKAPEEAIVFQFSASYSMTIDVNELRLIASDDSYNRDRSTFYF